MKGEKEFIVKWIKFLESKKGFGRTACKNFCIDCGGCKGQLLIAMLYWYLSLLEDIKK